MRHYQTLQKAHTHHNILFDDGSQTTRYSRYEKGVIAGEYRSIPVLIADEKGFDGMGFDATIGSQDDSYAALNLFTDRHRYIDTVAVNGATDIDHAVHLALTQFDYLGADYAVLVPNEGDSTFEPSFDSLCWSSDTLAKLTNSKDQDKGYYNPIITQKMLLTEQNRATSNEVMWDGMNLASHNNNYSRLLVDLQKNDSFNELTAKFDMAEMLAGMNVTELGLDALVDTNNRLDLMKERLFKALAKQSIDGLNVAGVTLTKPFKKNGVANVAMQFDLSDGQSFTILFHNPDKDPKKLGAQDMMVSWKWLLNKRDITAAVSPKNGENVQLPQLAMRMMKVAKANSKRFAAAQAKKAENQKALADAQKAVENKTATLVQLDKDIAELNSQIEEVSKVVVETPVEPVANVTENTSIQALIQEFNEYMQGKAAKNGAKKPFLLTEENLERFASGDLLIRPIATSVKPGAWLDVISADIVNFRKKIQKVLAVSADLNNQSTENSTTADPATEIFADDKDYQGTFKDDRDIFKAMDEAQNAIKDKGFPAWAIATANSDYVAVYILPDGKFSSSDTRESPELAYENMLKNRENQIKFPHGHNSAVLADNKPEKTTLDFVYDELGSYGWERKGEFIQKTFTGVAESGMVSNGDRILTGYFDEQERYLALQNPMLGDNVKPYIVETNIDMRDYGYNEEGYKNAAKAFNDKVNAYVDTLKVKGKSQFTPTPTAIDWDSFKAKAGEYGFAVTDNKSSLVIERQFNTIMGSYDLQLLTIKETGKTNVMHQYDTKTNYENKSYSVTFDDPMQGLEHLKKTIDSIVKNDGGIIADKQTIDSGKHPAVLAEGTPDEMHYIGENSDGTSIYEDKKGLRHLSKFGGILMQAEPRTLTENGVISLPREAEFMTTQELREKSNSSQTTQDAAIPKAHPNYTQSDIDYLTRIINGEIDPLDADMDKIIAIGEKDETDPLFEQALQIINDAEDKATAGV